MPARLLGLVPLVRLALLAGCGGTSDGDASGQTTVTVTATPTPSPTPTPTETPSASPTPSPTGPPDCQTSLLSAALANPQGAAGHTISDLVLTNTGSAPCSLGGYGGVSYVGGEAGQQIGAAADRDPGSEARFTLQPGGKAVAQLNEANAGNYDAATCQPTKVFGLAVIPPNQTEPVIVRHRTTGCANTAVKLLRTKPYQPQS